ncbi:MAG: DUF4349 domain-containing protein [Actinomycetota bacterium]|nr:DUF4349 domain-containing protein [Actinomycetota bacterium]
MERMCDMRIRIERDWKTFLLVAAIAGAIITPVLFGSLNYWFAESESGVFIDDSQRMAGDLPAPEAFQEESAKLAGDEPALPALLEGEGLSSSDRLVIKNKFIEMAVDDLRESFRKIDEVAKKFGGYTLSSNIYSNEDDYPVLLREGGGGEEISLSGNIIIKVAAENFEAAVIELKELGRIESEQETLAEVSEEHIDLTARLGNYERQEQRYLEILNAAKTVEDMVKIEEALTRVRGEIESIKGQLDYLDRNIAMATITLDLTEPRSITQPIFDFRIADALRAVSKNLIGIVGFLIVMIGTLMPFVLLGYLGWRVYIRFVEKKKVKETGA